MMNAAEFDSTTTSVERWDDEKEQLPKDQPYTGTLFDFGCFESKDGKDYVTFGFRVEHDGATVRCQRFYEVHARNYWVLKQDITKILGHCPPAAEIQRVDADGKGRTGPVMAKLMGRKVQLYYGTRDSWTDLYIDDSVIDDSREATTTGFSAADF